MRRMMVLGTTTLLSGGLAGGIYLAETPAPTTPNAAEASAISALVTMPPQDARRAMPSDFVALNDYRPQVSDGYLTNPRGGCSSPVPLPSQFEPICRQHDLGYDLLRTAQATGGTLPPEARRTLDHRFSVELHQVCTGRPGGLRRATCNAWADVAATAVEVNSWRQHWSSPTETPASVAAIAAALVSALSGAAGLVFGGRLLRARLRRLRPMRVLAGVRA